MDALQANQNMDVGRIEECKEIQHYSSEILVMVVPLDFRVLVLEAYDGSQDPNEHLAAFELQMQMSGGNDAIKCKMF